MKQEKSAVQKGWIYAYYHITSESVSHNELR